MPETLEGVSVKIDGIQQILHAGELIELLMALYGYRKAPHLWQDYFVECVELCKSVMMRRLKSEPSVFSETSGKQVILVVHVDDVMIFGNLSHAQTFFEELQTKLLLKVVGMLKKEGDEVMYVGRLLRMVKHGFIWSGGES